MTQALTVITPGPDAALRAIDNAGLALRTRTEYKKQLARYLETGGDLTDAAALGQYARTLPNGSRAVLKSAIRTWARAQAEIARASATPQNVNGVQAILYRLQSLETAVKVEKSSGQLTHVWLSLHEVRALLATCEPDIRGQRDKLVLGLLVVGGLRRKEAADLKFEDVKLLPCEGRFRPCLAVDGKGARKRTVPVTDILAADIDVWQNVVGDGKILRSLGMNRKPGKSLSPAAIFNVVRKRGAMIGKPELAPHDLRRTFARIGFDAGIPIEQISVLLGHATIETTRIYLDIKLNLSTTIADFVPYD